MAEWLRNVVSSAVTVALIVVLTRWLSDAKGGPLPTIRDGSSLYQIKWQLRALSAVVVSFWSGVRNLVMARPSSRGCRSGFNGGLVRVG